MFSYFISYVVHFFDLSLLFEILFVYVCVCVLPIELISERKTHYLVDYYILHLWLYMAQQDHFNYNVSDVVLSRKYVLSNENR